MGLRPENVGPTYNREQKLLTRSLERYQGLVNANAPRQVVIAEVALMFRYAVLVKGAGALGLLYELWARHDSDEEVRELGAAIAESLSADIRRSMGYCECGDTLTGDGYPLLCRRCTEEADKAADEVDKVLGGVGDQTT